MNLEYRKTSACYLLIGLHFFLGIGGLFGGAAMILSPDGSLLHMPLNLLRYTAFHDFLIPGLLLFTILGVVPIITACFLVSEKPLKLAEMFCLYRSSHWAWNYSLYLGFILISWIAIEIYLIQAFSFIHIFYVFLGLLIQAVTLLPSVWEHYSRGKV